MSTTTMQRAPEAVADVASGATDEARSVAANASARAGELVHAAKDETRDLAGTVRERASEVTGELVDQGRNVVQETRSQVESRASAGADQLATAFRDLGEEARALAEGRPEDAPRLTDYVGRAADSFYGAADRLHSLAGDVQERGLSGVLEDAQDYARRRPGMFLLGAAALGFGIGRVVKAERQRKAEEADEAEEPGVGVRATQGRQAYGYGRQTSQSAVRPVAVR